MKWITIESQKAACGIEYQETSTAIHRKMFPEPHLEMNGPPHISSSNAKARLSWRSQILR
jgi:hypothetical protein